MTGNPALQAEILAALEDETQYLPYGRTGGTEVTPYTQHTGPACFYASLIAIQAMQSGGSPLDERQIMDASRTQGLLEEFGEESPGARTMRQDYEAQTQFARENLGLTVEFVDPHYPVPVVHRLVGALEDKDQVVFGLHSRKHWVVIDGLERAEGEGNVWTGMDPSGGRRIRYASRVLQQSLAIAGMPLVVVRDPTTAPSPSRFRPAGPPRFSGRGPSTRPRVSGRIVPPRFRPAGS